MWICTNKGFISIVRDRDNAESFIVRARRREHLKDVLGDVVVIETLHADYRWRAFIYEQDVVEIISKHISNIQYDDFKSSVKDEELHDTYLEVWHTVRRMQTKK